MIKGNTSCYKTSDITSYEHVAAFFELWFICFPDRSHPFCIPPTPSGCPWCVSWCRAGSASCPCIGAVLRRHRPVLESYDFSSSLYGPLGGQTMHMHPDTTSIATASTPCACDVLGVPFTCHFPVDCFCYLGVWRGRGVQEFALWRCDHSGTILWSSWCAAQDDFGLVASLDQHGNVQFVE